MNKTFKYNSLDIPKTKYISKNDASKEILFEPIYFQPPKCEINDAILTVLDDTKRQVFQNKFLEIEQTFLNEFISKFGKKYIVLFESKLTDSGLFVSGTTENYLECICILKIEKMVFDIEKDYFRVCVELHSLQYIKPKEKSTVQLKELFCEKVTE